MLDPPSIFNNSRLLKMTIDAGPIPRLASLEDFNKVFGSSNTDIAKRRNQVFTSLLNQSKKVSQPNFCTIGPEDLAILFDLYDRIFFKSWLSETLDSSGQKLLSFRLSTKMTRKGGSFVIYSSGKLQITIAVSLLYQQFKKSKSAVIVNGLKCPNRLTALQAVLEHEITHLAETLLWTRTSCKKARFKGIAYSVFGHTEYVHKMLTTDRLAVLEYGIEVGTKVSFDFKGQEYQGFVNRITKRATVLVKHTKGLLYSDRHRYKKYLVPVGDLKPIL